MTEIASVRNLLRLGLLRPNKVERVAPDVNMIDRFRDLRHMTGNTLTARTARMVMRMLLNTGGVRSVLCVEAVTCQAKGIAFLAHNSWIVGAVRIVTTEASYPARIHQTLNKIIPLHSVLMRGPVWKMREGRLSKLMFL